MAHLKPLPSFFADRYRNWRTTGYAAKEDLFRQLVAEGQKPSAMVISCCDSRVSASALFQADPGDLFVHRNIASLVPPYQNDGAYHGTPAAIEYAVTALKVAHIIVIGHSSCGGVKGCHDMCSGAAPQLADKTSFVGRWIEILRPGYAAVKDIPDEADRLEAFEKEAVRTSLRNLETYPFVATALKSGDLSLHGLWNNLGEGVLEQYLPEEGFSPL